MVTCILSVSGYQFCTGLEPSTALLHHSPHEAVPQLCIVQLQDQNDVRPNDVEVILCCRTDNIRISTSNC